MHLTLGERTYDVTTRALVVAVVGLDGLGSAPPRPDGADIVELDVPAGTRAVTVANAVAALAKLAGVPVAIATNDPDLRRAAVDAGSVGALGREAVTANTPAAVAVAVLNGCRLIRTTDVRGARRVVDVLAAVMEAT